MTLVLVLAAGALLLAGIWVYVNHGQRIARWWRRFTVRPSSATQVLLFLGIGVFNVLLSIPDFAQTHYREGLHQALFGLAWIFLALEAQSRRVERGLTLPGWSR